MTFTVTDKNFNKLYTLDKAINIQWIQRFFLCGEFSIQLLGNTPITDDWHYIICDERPNTGIIQQKKYTKSIKGIFLQISGYFMEFELSDWIVTSYTINPSTSTIDAKTGYLYYHIDQMVQNYVDSSDVDKIDNNDDMFYSCIYDWYNSTTNQWESFGNITIKDINTENFHFDISNQDLMSAVYELSVANGTSIRYAYDTSYYKRTPKVFKILNAPENSNVIFTEERITDFTYTYDESNYKNFAIASATLYDGTVVTVEKDIRKSTDERKHMLMLNCESLTSYTRDDGTEVYYTSDKQDEVKSVLESNAVAELENYKKITNITYKMTTSDNDRFIYNKDYKIGDIVTIQLDSIGLTETRQITEVEEVWKKNQHIIYLTFGDSLTSIITKAVRQSRKKSITK